VPTAWRNVKATALCKYDFLLRLLLRASINTAWRAIALGVVIYGFVFMGFGASVSIANRNAPQFLSMFDEREFWHAVFIWLVCGSVALAYYVWEPTGIIDMFQGLENNGVVGRRKRGRTTSSPRIVEKFLLTQLDAFNKKFHMVITLGVTLSMLLVFKWQESFVRNPFAQAGYVRYWWDINPLYYWVLWLPLSFLGFYVVLWVLIRRIIAVRILYRLLDTHHIEPKLLHHDKANGLAPVGHYSLRISLLLVFASLWLMVTLLYPSFFNASLEIGPDFVVYVALYVVALPVFLILPAWRTHVIMVQQKQHILDTLAAQIRERLGSVNTLPRQVRDLPGGTPNTASPTAGQHTPQDLESVAALEQEYNLYDRDLATWPFSRRSVFRFILSGLGALFLTILPIILDKLF
jgi:hypothetical protein